jgi:hypothetical protein
MMKGATPLKMIREQMLVNKKNKNFENKRVMIKEQGFDLNNPKLLNS